MSVATHAHTPDLPADAATAVLDSEVVDIAAWLDHSASLREAPGAYVPRHRADGPAL